MIQSESHNFLIGKSRRELPRNSDRVCEVYEPCKNVVNQVQ